MTSRSGDYLLLNTKQHGMNSIQQTRVPFVLPCSSLNLLKLQIRRLPSCWKWKSVWPAIMGAKLGGSYQECTWQCTCSSWQTPNWFDKWTRRVSKLLLDVNYSCKSRLWELSQRAMNICDWSADSIPAGFVQSAWRQACVQRLVWRSLVCNLQILWAKILMSASFWCSGELSRRHKGTWAKQHLPCVKMEQSILETNTSFHGSFLVVTLSHGRSKGRCQPWETTTFLPLMHCTKSAQDAWCLLRVVVKPHSAASIGMLNTRSSQALHFSHLTFWWDHRVLLPEANNHMAELGARTWHPECLDGSSNSFV